MTLLKGVGVVVSAPRESNREQGQGACSTAGRSRGRRSSLAVWDIEARGGFFFIFVITKTSDSGKRQPGWLETR